MRQTKNFFTCFSCAILLAGLATCNPSSEPTASEEVVAEEAVTEEVVTKANDRAVDDGAV